MSWPGWQRVAGLRRADLVATLALPLLVLFCWPGITGGFWRADDPALVLHALQSPGLAAFTDPADWQRLSPSNLTPWVTLSFKLDLALAGPSPRAFYVHQLLSTALVAVAAYALARRALPPAWALLVVLLGLAGAPTAAVTELAAGLPAGAQRPPWLGLGRGGGVCAGGQREGGVRAAGSGAGVPARSAPR